MKTTKNLIGIWPNLARAVEVAKAGGHSITVVYQEDYPGAREDYGLIVGFFDAQFQPNGDIVIEITQPAFDRIPPFIRAETLADIEKRIEEASKNERPEHVYNETNKCLIKLAYERLHLSVSEVCIIEELAATIAQLDGSKNIQAHHVAEAIQYRAGAHEEAYISL